MLRPLRHHHAAVKAFLGELDGKLGVPALVLAELDHLVGMRLGELARSAVMSDVLDTMAVILFDQSAAVRAAAVAGGYGGFPLGLTDATLGQWEFPPAPVRRVM